MNGLVPLLLIATGVGIGFHPVLGLGHRGRLWGTVLVCTVLLVMPFLLLQAPGLGRVALGICCVLLALKIVDVSIGAEKGHVPGLRQYLAFLPNFGSFVWRKADAEPTRSGQENVWRLVKGVLLIGGGLLLLQGGFIVDWRNWTFVLEHTAKATGFFLGVLGMFEILTTIARLTGAPARVPHTAPLAARTPADFWRRYNRLIQQFFHENVFKPLGGRRRPVMATLVVFYLSGVLHEYAFSLGAGHFQGYQLTFFMLQGLAVVATLRIKPKGVVAIPWVVGTLAFNLATGTLFLASLHQILPIYVNPLPGWLAGW